MYDTDLTENGAFLGDIRPYDEVQNAIKDELIACEKIEPLEYNGRSDYYIPLNSSYNIPVAYIIVGISTENVRREQLTCWELDAMISCSIFFMDSHSRSSSSPVLMFIRLMGDSLPSRKMAIE